MKKVIFAVLLIAMMTTSASCKKEGKQRDYKGVEPPIVTMEFEKFGTIEIELYPEYAPNTVENFISLIEKGFYNGLTIHRVSPQFVIQGGDPKGNGTGGPGYKIKGEFKANGFKQNTLKHTQGVISMARSKDNDSAGSQFFIMLTDKEGLDGGYAAFGKVIKGLDIVLDIGLVEVFNERPLEEIVINKVTVDTKGVDYDEPEKIK